MLSRDSAWNFLAFGILLLALCRIDLESVISVQSNYFISSKDFSPDLGEKVMDPFYSLSSFSINSLPSIDLSDRLAREFRQQSFVVAFNPGGEVAVLTGKTTRNARNVPLNNALAVVANAPASLLQNSSTASSAAFNARIEALGDLFMDETYLQSNLDLDEITAVAGHVTKEDLDVQRLVDVLWSQEVDLGANREWLEYSLRPPQPQPLTPQTALEISSNSLTAKNNHAAVSAASGKGLAKAESSLQLAPQFPPLPFSSGRDGNSNAFVDSETGEVVGRLSSGVSVATGNDSRDPGSDSAGLVGFNRTVASPSHNATVQPNLNGTLEIVDPGQNEAERRMEDRNWQSLVQALDNLNSSTMQVVNESGRGGLEERWQDVQSVITQPSSPDSGTGSLNLLSPNTSQTLFEPLSAYLNPSFGLNSASPSLQRPSFQRLASFGSTNDSSLSQFDFLSMFMDPPANYSLPAGPQNNSTSSFNNQQSTKYNLSEFLTFPTGTGFNGSTVTPINPSNRSPINHSLSMRSPQDVYGSLLTNATGRPLVYHEGPVDMSAFGFFPEISAAHQVPVLGSEGNVQNGAFDWGMNLTGDWSNSMAFASGGNHAAAANGQLSGASSGVSSGNMSEFAVPSQSGSDYLPALNSSGNLVPPLSASSAGSSLLTLDWPLATPSSSGNTTEMLRILDEAKRRLDKQHMVPDMDYGQLIKEEEEDEKMELDPWTQRVTLLAAQNHSYARPPGSQPLRKIEKREGSEEDRDSSTSGLSSTSDQRRNNRDSVSQPRSISVRNNRDERAATEQALPVTAEEIVMMPVEEFNNYVAGTSNLPLTNDQIQLMKDIRRRGKNKVAAQNCRRRKIDNMDHLEKEIHDLRRELAAATSHRNQLARQRDQLNVALVQGSSSMLLPRLSAPVSVIQLNPLPSSSSSSSRFAQNTSAKRAEKDAGNEQQKKRKRAD